MARTQASVFAPDYAVRPGDSLQETLDALNMSQAQLAERTGRPKKTINEIVNGKATIMPDTALQFERVLGVPADFWLALEQQYQSALAREAERERLSRQVEWLKSFPLPAMVKAGYLPDVASPVEQLQGLLSFFGVASKEAWHELWCSRRAVAAFRASMAYQAGFEATSAWLRRAELLARDMECGAYQAERFRQSLQTIRASLAAPFQEVLEVARHECAEAGVAFMLVRELTGMRVSGATRWLSPEKAMIVLTLRYKSDDQFWFTFFHEAAHILLHRKKTVFVEAPRTSADHEEEQEREADRFARDLLVPPHAYAGLIARGSFSEATIRSFAAEQSLPPGVVLGYLQHDKVIPWPTPLNRKLKRTLRWADEARRDVTPPSRTRVGAK